MVTTSTFHHDQTGAQGVAFQQNRKSSDKVLDLDQGPNRFGPDIHVDDNSQIRKSRSATDSFHLRLHNCQNSISFFCTHFVTSF